MLYLNSFLVWLNLEVNWEDFESRCFVFNFTAVIPKRVQGRKKNNSNKPSNKNKTKQTKTNGSSLEDDGKQVIFLKSG